MCVCGIWHLQPLLRPSGPVVLQMLDKHWAIKIPRGGQILFHVQFAQQFRWILAKHRILKGVVGKDKLWHIARSTSGTCLHDLSTSRRPRLQLLPLVRLSRLNIVTHDLMVQWEIMFMNFCAVLLRTRGTFLGWHDECCQWTGIQN